MNEKRAPLFELTAQASSARRLVILGLAPKGSAFPSLDTSPAERLPVE
jgi:hypothetical protein